MHNNLNVNESRRKSYILSHSDAYIESIDVPYSPWNKTNYLIIFAIAHIFCINQKGREKRKRQMSENKKKMTKENHLKFENETQNESLKS